MFEFLKHVLNGQNQFASGGLLLMILGSIGVFLRALPERLWWWLVDQTTMTENGRVRRLSLSGNDLVVVHSSSSLSGAVPE